MPCRRASTTRSRSRSKLQRAALGALPAVLLACSLISHEDPEIVVSITPGVSASFAGYQNSHQFTPVVTDLQGSSIAGTRVSWTLVTPSTFVSVDTAGLVTVASNAPAGDYAIQASARNSAAVGRVRVLPRPAGKLVFSSTVSGNAQVFIKDFSKDDEPVQLTTGTGSVSGLAADVTTGTIIFARTSTAGTDLYGMQFDGSGLINLTNAPASVNQVPTIHPITHDVYFVRRVGGVGQVFRMRQDGTDLTQVTAGSQSKATPAISPNGASLAWAELYQPGSNLEIIAATIAGANPVRLTDRTGTDANPMWLSNSRIVFAVLLTSPSFNSELFQVDAPAGENLANLTDAPSVDTQPSVACVPNALTFLSSRSGQMDAYHWDLTSHLIVRYRLGSSVYPIGWAQRVCQ